MDEEGVAKVFVSPLTLATAPLSFCLGQRVVGLPPRLRPLGRQPKTEIGFGLCYNNDATTVKNGRSALHALCSAPRIANGDAAVGCWVEESFYYVRTRRATSARPSRPSRVVKELMAALMRFPAAVYQFSFVNVAPFFPPSVGDPLARSRHFNSWMELIHYAEPSVSHRGGGGFRPPALRAPIRLAAATRGISGVLYHSLYTLPSVM